MAARLSRRSIADHGRILTRSRPPSRPLPSLARIVAADLQLTLIVALAGGMWLLGLLSLFYVARLEDPRTPGLILPGDVLLLLAAAFTIAAVVPVVLRSRDVRQIFRAGVPVEARVEAVWLWRARTRVLYSYQHGGRRYERVEAFNWNERASGLKPGDSCPALVDPTSPYRAFLQLRYL